MEMSWYRSSLITEAEPATIAHFFQCPNCNRITETRSRVKSATPVDPSKLSLPQQRFSCAA